VDLFSAMRKRRTGAWTRVGAYCQQETDRSSSRFCCLGVLHLSGVSCRKLEVCAECIPKTMRESVPSVSEAFLPTASVSGTYMCSCVGLDGCGGCESASEELCDEEVVKSRGSCGSRKGSSPPLLEAMVIQMLGKSWGDRTACCARMSDNVRRKLTSVTQMRTWQRMLAGASRGKGKMPAGPCVRVKPRHLRGGQPT
jgi:hypothetical protein